MKLQERVAVLEKELANLRRDAEKGLGAARDEFEGMKKKLVVEIDTLTRRCSIVSSEATLSIYLSTYLSIYLYIYISVYLSIYQSSKQSFNLSIYILI